MKQSSLDLNLSTKKTRKQELLAQMVKISHRVENQEKLTLGLMHWIESSTARVDDLL